MGRKKCDIVRKYFKDCNAVNKLRCIIEECASEISNHSTNLVKHLENHHPNEFTVVMMEKESYKRTPGTGTCTRSNNRKKAKFDLMDTCLRLVTIHGRPFSLIDDEAFRDIINMVPQTEVINAHKVRNAVMIEADTVRNKIKDEIVGKLISLKADSATCMGRSFLGINIQFLKKDKIQIRTLGVVELFQGHTAEYLKFIIMNTCSRFGISMKQIYTVTVDNAANMLKTVRILSDEDEQNNIEDSSDDSADIITESEVIEVLLNQEARAICLDDIETSEFLNETDFTITAIRCAAHTLQLANCDFLKKKKEVSQIVEKARQIVRKLRTPLLKSTLSAMYGKNAILDCTTRWHSTLDMLERLFELKTYCEQIEDTDLKLSEIMWSKISALIEVLTPARVATKRLQSEQLLLGDLYEIWQRCIIETGKKDNEFATDVVTNMKNRQSKLLENEVIVSGIYMDPRYNVILTEPMIRVAKNCLLRTYSRMQSILSNVSNTEHNAVSNDVSDVSEEEEFEKLLKDAEATHACNKSLTQRSQCHIENEMDEYFKEPRLKSSSNILTYWNAKKNKMPELYELAQVILAVPPTQVSVERLFSGLKFILSPHRSKMNSDVIDNILLIRLNMQKLGGEKDANA